MGTGTATGTGVGTAKTIESNRVAEGPVLQDLEASAPNYGSN